MDRPSIAHVVGPVSSSVAQHALIMDSKHAGRVTITSIDLDSAAAAAAMDVKAASLTNDTFERVDSVMNDDNDAAAAAATVENATPVKGRALASEQPSGAPVMPVAKAMDVARDRKVRVLGLHEWKAAALSLAEAFAEDHSSLYFLDTPERAHWTAQQKWDLHLKIMEYITYAHFLTGLVVSAGPDYDCVGLWMPPGRNTDSMLTILRSGLWRLNYLLCREGRKRFFNEFLPLLTDTKAAVLGPALDADSYYLVYIGTRPTSRGKGYARGVIEHVTCLADREGKPCYLESSHAVNRLIYGKLGFQLIKNIYLQRAEQHVELDIMVRHPVVVESQM